MGGLTACEINFLGCTSGRYSFSLCYSCSLTLDLKRRWLLTQAVYGTWDTSFPKNSLRGIVCLLDWHSGPKEECSFGKWTHEQHHVWERTEASESDWIKLWCHQLGDTWCHRSNLAFMNSTPFLYYVASIPHLIVMRLNGETFAECLTQNRM